MRTESSVSSAGIVGRFRAPLARARRYLLTRGPAVRWSLLLLAAITALVALGYWSAPSATGRFLFSGRRFSQDDLVKIGHALDAKNIRFEVDNEGRVEVSSEDVATASQALSKLELGQRSLADIEKQASEAPFWVTLSEKEEREARKKEEKLEVMIGQLDGIVRADVGIILPKNRKAFRPAADPKALVYLETEGDRELGFETVRSIQGLLVAAVPELKPHAVTVYDRKGHNYLEAGDQTLGTTFRTRAREEELRRKIERELDCFKGVRVSVQLTPIAAPVPAPTAAPAGTTHEPEPREVWVGVNKPADLESEHKPSIVPSPLPQPPPRPVEHARILVRIPRSYYLKLMPDREPSMEQLQPIVDRTKETIRMTVSHVVPRAESPEVMIETFPDVTATSTPAVPPMVPEPRQSAPWLALAAASGTALGALLLLFGYRLVTSRRPVLRPVSMARDSGRYQVDGASKPGPSDRVRELIRLNPQAAASVLNRWVGQGGSLG